VSGDSSRARRGRVEAGPSDGDNLESAYRFFRQWLREPRAIAALAPSGRALATRMAAAVGRDASAVVELGGGTGVMTRALLERGIAPERLLVVELNPELHALLAAAFPGVEVVRANATDLVAVVRGSRGLVAGAVDAVLSSLGFLTMAREDQRRVLAAAFEVLRPAGRFVQFTYAPRVPVRRELREQLGLEARRVSWSLRNLPPAFVYVLRRRRTAPRRAAGD
jgi:phosphatidylethanolamine/phosphatidyl-N-methylethanolamine N-methyltransferase